MPEQNLEQLEALQVKKNAQNAEEFETLTEDQKQKFLAVKEATEILVKAKIPAYIFALLDVKSETRPRCYQYNTLGTMNTTLEIGFMDKASKKRNHLLNRGIVLSMMNLLSGKWCGQVLKEETIKETVNFIYNIYRYAENGQDPWCDNIDKLEK